MQGLPFEGESEFWDVKETGRSAEDFRKGS
jgi:hypothetical protein